jgi:hypothetical protein
MEIIELEQKQIKAKGKPKGIKRYKYNPFAEETQITVKRTKMRFVEIKSSEPVKIGDTQIGQGLYTAVEQVVSGEQFVKIYGRYANIWFDLSPASLKIFGLFYAMVLNSSPETTYFYLSNSDPILKRYVKTPGTFHAAIRELISKRIIERHFSEGWYWINPYVMGRGDQIKILTNLKLQHSPKSHQEIADLLDNKKSTKVNFKN